MKTLHGIMVASALAIFACAAPIAAFAQNGNQNDRNQDRRQTQSSQDRSDAQRAQDRARQAKKENDQRNQKSQANRGDMQKGEISGKGQVRRTKKVGIKGQPVEHLVVLFRAPSSDRDRVADLGPVKNLKNSPVRSGDNLRMVGRVVKVGDKPVLMVRKFYTDEEPDKAIVIVRKSKDQKSSQQRSQDQRSQDQARRNQRDQDQRSQDRRTARNDDSGSSENRDNQNQSRQNRANSSSESR